LEQSNPNISASYQGDSRLAWERLKVRLLEALVKKAPLISKAFLRSGTNSLLAWLPIWIATSTSTTTKVFQNMEYLMKDPLNK
jgi:hypothetical protein